MMMMVPFLNIFLVLLLSSVSLLASALVIIPAPPSAIAGTVRTSGRVSWIASSLQPRTCHSPLELTSSTTTASTTTTTQLFMGGEKSDGGDVKRGTVKWFDTMKVRVTL
jgi:hypothetical protein